MNVVIYGKGDFAKLVLHYLEKDSNYNVVGFCVDEKYIGEGFYLEYPVYNVDKISNELDVNDMVFFVAVGYSSMVARKKMFDKAQSLGFKFINIICEGASIDNSAELGTNNIFMPGVTVEPFSKVGNNNIFWSGSLVCHDVIIENHNFFAAKSIIGGFSKVSECSFFGFSAVVVDNITVGSDVVLGASSLLLEDILSSGTYHGSPAKYKH